MSTRYLLDSQVLLWYLSNDARLLKTISTMLENALMDISVSTASIWEIEIKRMSGRLTPPSDPMEVVLSLGFHVLDITPEQALVAARLPRHHGDPFDRMIVAQARLGDMTLVTADWILPLYGVPILFARA